jgi:hypothetical protein
MKKNILLFAIVFFLQCNTDIQKSDNGYTNYKVVAIYDTVTIDTILPFDDTLYLKPSDSIGNASRAIGRGCDCTQVFAPIDTSVNEISNKIYEEQLTPYYKNFLLYGDSISYKKDTIRDIDKYTVYDYRESIENLSDPNMFVAVYNRGPIGIFYSRDTANRVDTIYHIYNNTPLGGGSKTYSLVLRIVSICYSEKNRIASISEHEKTIRYDEDSCHVYESSWIISNYYYTEPVFAKFEESVMRQERSSDTAYNITETYIFRVYIANLAIICVYRDLRNDEVTIDTLFIPELYKRKYCGNLSRKAELYFSDL